MSSKRFKPAFIFGKADAQFAVGQLDAFRTGPLSTPFLPGAPGEGAVRPPRSSRISATVSIFRERRSLTGMTRPILSIRAREGRIGGISSAVISRRHNRAADSVRHSPVDDPGSVAGLESGGISGCDELADDVGVIEARPGEESARVVRELGQCAFAAVGHGGELCGAAVDDGVQVGGRAGSFAASGRHLGPADRTWSGKNSSGSVSAHRPRSIQAIGDMTDLLGKSRA